MFDKKTLVAAVTVSALFITGCATSYSEEEIGFRKSNLYSEDTTMGDATNYSKVAPGESKVIARAFENAPPMISHSVEGMLPITGANNTCVSCHAPEVAVAVKATPVPKSHLATFRPMTEYVNGSFKKEGKMVNNTADIKTVVKKKASIAGERYNCTLCHAPQSDNKIWVQNEFQPEFRQANGMKRSNLLDNLNEGVK